ncbi:MAG: Hsp70 family protein, partial [Clostridia bacterium]|nr:Hsp70 family protein [Clostridia bacterium]
ITASSNLKEEDIEKAVKEAEAHAEEDKKRREVIEIRNQADQLVYSVEKMVKENGDKITDDDKKVLEEESEKLKKVIADENADADTIRKAIDEFSQKSNAIVSKLYQGAQNAQTPNGDAPKTDGDPEVVVE